MTKTRFTQWVVLACIGTVAACTSGDGGTAGNTELNVVVPNNAGGPDGDIEIDIQRVEYTIACAGNDDTFLDNDAFFADQVRIDGNLEVADGRTNPGVNVCDGGNFPGAVCINPASPSPAECQGTSPTPDGNCVSGADFGGPLPASQTEIWQGFMDLPPGPCSVQLRARDNDGEVICTATEPFVITADVTTKVNVLLICDTSFQAPVGSLDVDGTFSFNVGNFCPDLIVFNALDSGPLAEEDDIGLGFLAGATTGEVRLRDGDNGCGANCDPQTCVPSAAGLSCTAAYENAEGPCVGADDPTAPTNCGAAGQPECCPPVKTTITCSSVPPGSFGISCLAGTGSGNSAFLGGEDTCTILGDQTGFLPEFIPGPIPCPNDDPGTPGENEGDDACATALGAPVFPGFPGSCQNNVCNYSSFGNLLNASMALVAGLPPLSLGGPPGVVLTCVATTTDGDTDCDKQKTITVLGAGLSPCADLCGFGNENNCVAGPGSGTCEDTNSCTGAVCDDSSGAAVCSNPPLSDTTTCDDFLPAAGTCDGAGICVLDGCTVDGDCALPTQCTAQALCDNGVGGTFQCLPPADANEGLGCDAGGGADTGICTSGVCVAADDCAVDGDCPDDLQVCTVPSCNTTPIPNVCELVAGNDGAACDQSTGETGTDGECIAGTCSPIPPDPQTVTTISSCALPTTVSTNLVPFPTVVSVTPTTPALAGQTFTATLDPAIVLDAAFLQAAAETLFEGFNIFFTELNLTTAQVQMAATAGCGQVCVPGPADPGFNDGVACTADVDCDADGVQPYTGHCIAPPGALTADTGTIPRIITIPNAPWTCTTDADCQATNALDSGICCTGANTPPGPGFCSGGADDGAFCDVVGPDAPRGSTCPGGTCVIACGAANECNAASVPPQITGGVALDSFDPVSYSCPAAAAGETIAICTTGIRAGSVTPTASPTQTFVRVDVGALTNIGFDCETGSAQNPNACECPASGVTFCTVPINNSCPTGELCFPADVNSTKGDCSGPVPFTLKYDPTGSICASVDANAGVACTDDTGCDAPCDTDTNLCADGTTACGVTGVGILNPDVDCDVGNAGGGTCVPACATFPVL